MAATFNLLDEPWIPVVPRHGPPRDVSVREALCQAHAWQEVYDNSPLVTVAVHRLLLAILYRALPAATLEDADRQWQALWTADTLPCASLEAYFAHWHDRFDLFSTDHPFYQTAGLAMGSSRAGAADASPIARLAHELASGNNATLFDHRHDEMGAVSPAIAARLLLAMQAFAMGGGISGAAIIDGQSFPRPNAQHGPLVSGLTVWLHGASLQRTLLLNFAPDISRDDDLPPWEQPPQPPAQVIAATERATPRGRIDLLTWQSRLIRLIPDETDGTLAVRRVWCTQGRPVGDTGGYFDPMKCYRKHDERGYLPLRLSEDRAHWCDYHTLLALAKRGGKMADALTHVAEQAAFVPREARYGLHAVGMVNDQAKVVLWRHDRPLVQPALLRDPDLIEDLEILRQEVEHIGRRLRTSVLRVCYLFTVPNTERIDEACLKRLRSPKPRETDIVEAQALASTIDPSAAFWARLEEPFYHLLADLPAAPDAAMAHWRETITREASRAFEEACRALGTAPRALRAVARVTPHFTLTPIPEEIPV